MNSESLCAPGDQPEKERERERENERKNDTGRPSLNEQGPQLDFQKELLYLKLYIENNGRCRAMQGQQSRPSRDQAFFLHTYLYTQVLGDLHHLARKPVNIL